MTERVPHRKRHRRPLRAALRALAGDSVGGTAIEYGLIASLVIITMIASLYGLANQTVFMWNSVSSKVQNAQ